MIGKGTQHAAGVQEGRMGGAGSGCREAPHPLLVLVGVKNSLVAHDMAFEMARAPWNPEQQIERPRLTKRVLDTEDQAAFRLQSKIPRYIYFAANSKNKWGHQRGYRIQIVSFAGDHVPEASSMERAISWARSGCCRSGTGFSKTPPASGWGGITGMLPMERDGAEAP